MKQILFHTTDEKAKKLKAILAEKGITLKKWGNDALDQIIQEQENEAIFGKNSIV